MLLAPECGLCISISCVSPFRNGTDAMAYSIQIRITDLFHLIISGVLFYDNIYWSALATAPAEAKEASIIAKFSSFTNQN